MFPSRRITTMGGDKFRDDFSLAFDGTDDYIQTGAVLSYNVNTVSAWFKFVANSENKIIIDTRDANDDGILLYVGGDERLYYNNDTVDTNTGVLTGGVWYHAVGTNDGSTSSLYLNGVLQTTADTSGVTVETAANLKIGARSHTSGASFFEGNISEVAIYNAALSASQAKTLYNGGEPYNHKEGVASGNLQAWYRMGDGDFDRHKIPSKFKTGVDNGDRNTYLITDCVNPTISAEKYTAANALADLNNANSIDELDNQDTPSKGKLYEGGSLITSGTAQIEDGRTGKKAINIVSTSDEDRVVVDLDHYLTKGKVYLLTCVAKHSGGDDVATIRIADSSNLDSTGDYFTIETLGTSETGWAFYGTVFIHTSSQAAQGSTEWFGAREAGSNNDAEFYISELSIVEIGGNAGVMTNMSLDDFEGDTP